VTGLTEQERDALSFALCAPDPDRKPVTEIQAASVRAAVERILTARLAEAELVAALEAGDACGAVGCRALAERDALLAMEARVRALADEWDARGREAKRYINRAHHTEIHEVMAEARWFPSRAAELREALDGPPA